MLLTCFAAGGHWPVLLLIASACSAAVADPSMTNSTPTTARLSVVFGPKDETVGLLRLEDSWNSPPSASS